MQMTIVVLAKSKCVAERLLEACLKYLEGRLKLKMNTEKSKVTSIFAQKKSVSWILFGQEWKRYLYPCAPKVSCQGEGKAEASYKAQPWTQCPQGNAGSEGVHPRLDWLLSSSRYETNADVLGQMDAAQVPNVHLEAVEEAQNKGG